MQTLCFQSLLPLLFLLYHSSNAHWRCQDGSEADCTNACTTPGTEATEPTDTERSDDPEITTILPSTEFDASEKAEK